MTDRRRLDRREVLLLGGEEERNGRPELRATVQWPPDASSDPERMIEADAVAVVGGVRVSEGMLVVFVKIMTFVDEDGVSEMERIMIRAATAADVVVARRRR